MRLMSALLIGFLTLMTHPAFAEGDVEAGKAAFATCVACHGASAEGNKALNAPRLVHLDTVYIVAQLEKFQTGVRGGEGASDSARQMAGMAGTLADQQSMVDVASYIATLEAPAAAATLEGDAAVGADYYNQFCGACHGAKAEGNTALNSPPLSGADDWYLKEQLLAFRTGTRGSHPDDRTGKQMRAMVGLLPDEQTITNVVVFARSANQ